MDIEMLSDSEEHEIIESEYGSEHFSQKDERESYRSDSISLIQSADPRESLIKRDFKFDSPNIKAQNLSNI
jgi:hypothetical protein